MADGIGKGVAGQLAGLGRDIASEVIKTPAKLAGFDTGTQETKGAGKGGKAQAGTQQHGKQPSEGIDPLAFLRQKDEVEKQQGIAQARRLIQQFLTPQNQPPQTLEQQRKQEELQKQQEELAQMKAEAMTLRDQTSKPKRGNLFQRGMNKVKKQKVFGSEQSKDAHHQ